MKFTLKNGLLFAVMLIGSQLGAKQVVSDFGELVIIAAQSPELSSITIPSTNEKFFVWWKTANNTNRLKALAGVINKITRARKAATLALEVENVLNAFDKDSLSVDEQALVDETKELLNKAKKNIKSEEDKEASDA